MAQFTKGQFAEATGISIRTRTRSGGIRSSREFRGAASRMRTRARNASVLWNAPRAKPTRSPRSRSTGKCRGGSVATRLRNGATSSRRGSARSRSSLLKFHDGHWRNMRCGSRSSANSRTHLRCEVQWPLQPGGMELIGRRRRSSDYGGEVGARPKRAGNDLA